MAQSGYTPLLVYGSSTAAAEPTAPNLTSSANGAELALNYADGKLFYKNSGGNVRLLAIGYGASTVTPTAGGIQYGTGTAVAFTAAGTAGYILQSNGASAPSWVAAPSTSPGGSTTQVQYNNAGAFGGSANFVWDNTNVRLGIGTSSPNVALDVVSGSVNTSGDSLTDQTSSVTGPNRAFSTHVGVLNVATNTAPGIDVGGSIGFGGRWTGTVQAGFALIKGAKENASTGYASYLAFYTRPDSTPMSERMRIDSSGNVGIGVTPPTVSQGRLLSLAYSGSGISVTSGTSLDLTDNAYYNTAWKYGQNGLSARFQLTDDQFIFYNATTGTAGNNITWSERMRINASGNVGIADSSPGYKLTVASNALIYTDSVSSNNYSLTNGGTNYGGGVAPYLTVAGAGGSYGYLLIKGGSGGTSNTATMGMANKNNGGNYILGALLGCEMASAVAGSESQYFKIATQDAGTGVADRIRITNANLYLTSQTTTSNATVFSIAAYQNGYPATGQYGSIDFVNGSPWYSGGRIVFKTNGNADITNTSPTERARISSTGGFSVGTTADPGAGAIYATGNITAYYSDARLKDVKGTIANALDKVSSLSGVYYTNNEVAVAHGYTSTETQVGLLAQDVEAVLPEVVKAAPFDLDERGDSKSGEHYKTLQYERIIPLLVEAIKELRAEVKALRGE